MELERIEEWEDKYTIKDFKKIVRDGGFIDYDGTGILAYEEQKSDIVIYPSLMNHILEENKEYEFTYVVWYNK